MQAKHYNLILQYAYLIITSQYLNLAYSSQCDQLDNVTQFADIRDENFVQKNISSMTSTVNTTDFFVDGTRIVAENSGRYGFIEYMWDATGVTGMRRGGRNYFFVRDVFGNVVEVIDGVGVVVAQYRYDAWGNVEVWCHSCGGFCWQTASCIAHINPWRYRGYYMDRGTGLYYLQTRFYDPSVRRFINADNYMLVPKLAGQMGGLHMFAYALNNPVMYWDPSGQMAVTATITGIALLLTILKGLAVGAVVAGAVVGGIYLGTTIVNNWDSISGFFGTTVPILWRGFWGSRGLVPRTQSGTHGTLPWQDGWLFAVRSRGPVRPPTGVHRGMVRSNETPIQNANRIMNERWGTGNWNNRKGPGEEHNIIRKWVEWLFKNGGGPPSLA